MARYVLPVVGAVVGFIYGGPAGASLGWALGGGVASLVDPQVIKGPSVGDIVQQTSQEGVPRPIVFGLSQPMAGNVIVSGEPRIVKDSKSGKGGPKVESESVYRTYAIRICEGPIAGVLRVWRNNKLVYDARSSSDLSLADNTKFLRTARFFLGDFEQNPSPDLEALFGVGTTPAHRGTAYMVMADEQLNDTAGAIPQWQFQVTNKGTTIVNVSNGVLHPWNLSLPDPRNSLNEHSYVASGGGTSYDSLGAAIAYNSALLPIPLGYSGGSGAALQPHLHDYGGAGAPSNRMQFTLHVNRRFDTEWEHYVGPSTGPGLVDPCVYLGGYNGGIPSLGGTPVSGGLVAEGGVYAAGITAEQVASGNWRPSSVTSYGPGRWTDIQLSVSGTWNCAPTGQYFYKYYWPDTRIEARRKTGKPTADYEKIDGSFKVLSVMVESDLNDPNATIQQYPRNPCIEAGSPNDNAIFWATQYAAAVANGELPSGKTYNAAGTGNPASTYPVAQSWAYQRYVDSLDSEPIRLVDLIEEICGRAGLSSDMYDTSEIDPDANVYGLTLINTYPAHTILQSLSQVFFFAPSYYDGVVHFAPGGGNSVATITESEMLDDRDEDIEQSQRDDAIAVPRKMHLLYFDKDGGLATDKQTSERAGDRRAHGEQVLQSAVVMDADQAARAVAINHKVSIEELRGSLKFCLPDSWLGLVPANPIIVQWNGQSKRCRITKLEVLDGYQQYEAYHDRQSAFTSEVEGIPASPQTPPPSGVVGPTLIQPLDIHILRDSDDNAGLLFYAAISGTMPAWTGALIELSLDGGQTYVDSVTGAARSIMGSLESTLPDHPQAIPDSIHTVSVRVQTPLAEFDETDLAGLLNRQNIALVGDEIIQFAQAEETSEGTWDLSYLLRGRKGTQTKLHGIGERFVMLDRGRLGVIPASVADIGRTFTFRATSFGETEDTATVVSMIYTGQSQTEREAGYLSARMDGSNAIVQWQGVGRLGAGAQVAQGVRFTGYRVRFEGADSGDTPIEVDTASESITQDVSSLTQPIRITVAQVNGLTGAGPEIEVYI